MILVRTKADSDRHFLVDARYAGIDKVCRCIARLQGVEFTVPLSSYWRSFVWSGENAYRAARFTFRGHTYEVDDDCPFTGNISVRSEGAPVADVLIVQEHVEKTALSRLRMRTLLPIIALLLASCGRGPMSGEPFTTSRPALADIPGSYELVSQTATTNGLSALLGRSCQLELASDGTFSITNYLPDLVSATGHWRWETIGFDHGREMWGFRFDSSPRIEAAALSGSSAPYRLVMIFGDPDSDQMMIYEKKK